MPRFLTAILITGALLLSSPAASMSSPAKRHAGASRATAGQTRSRHPEGAELRRDIRLAMGTAASYWGSTPCGGQIVVTAAIGVPAGMATGTDAWVMFNSSLGADDLGAPPSTYTACRIGLARWQWPTTAAISSDWGMFCLTVIHEVGHLLGHPHSLAPGSVMAPVFTSEASVPAICRRQAPPRAS
jgi:hypothetical protein